MFLNGASFLSNGTKKPPSSSDKKRQQNNNHENSKKGKLQEMDINSSDNLLI